jgi:biotin carboxyl carrier protein
MKFEAKVESGGKLRNHLLELAAEHVVLREPGNVEVVVDGQLVRANSAAIIPGRHSVLVEGRSYVVRVRRSATSLNSAYAVAVGNRLFEVELQDPRDRRHRSLLTAHSGPEDVLAPMPGKVVKILSIEGARVAPGQGLLVIEAMKMQNEVCASRAGCVEKVYVREGQGVEAGSALARLVSS